MLQSAAKDLVPNVADSKMMDAKAIFRIVNSNLITSEYWQSNEP